MDPIVSSVLATGAEKGGEVALSLLNPICDLVKRLTGKYRLNHIRASFKSYAKGVRRVKTVWQIDKAVDLWAFYYPSKITIRSQTRVVRQYEDIRREGNILIEGVAGQGKSIFLRYFTSNEILFGEYLPLFIELNRLKQSEDLFYHIGQTVRHLGLPDDEKSFHAFAKTGHLMLCLDAFDEVDESIRTRTLNQIDYLAEFFPELKIIITSRPENQVRFIRSFEVAQLAPLADPEHELVIGRLLDDAVLREQLIKALRANPNNIGGLLTTPLLVTLLVTTYKPAQVVPETLGAFYAQLFMLLLRRHDGAKAGFMRKRECSIGDTQYTALFEALCFESKSFGRQSCALGELVRCASRASELTGISVDPESYVNDICRITCLILRDGDVYRFVHKTVIEFYAASYISKKPEAVVQGFYNRIIRNGVAWVGWRNELNFLAEIDPYRFSRFAVLEPFLEFTSLSEPDLPKSKPDKLYQTFCRALLATKVFIVLEENVTVIESMTFPFLGFISDRAVRAATEICVKKFPRIRSEFAVISVNYGFDHTGPNPPIGRIVTIERILEMEEHPLKRFLEAIILKTVQLSLEDAVLALDCARRNERNDDISKIFGQLTVTSKDAEELNRLSWLGKKGSSKVD